MEKASTLLGKVNRTYKQSSGIWNIYAKMIAIRQLHILTIMPTSLRRDRACPFALAPFNCIKGRVYEIYATNPDILRI